MINRYKFFAAGRDSGIKFKNMVGEFSHDWEATGINPMDRAASIIRKTFAKAEISSLRVRRFTAKEEKSK